MPEGRFRPPLTKRSLSRPRPKADPSPDPRAPRSEPLAEVERITSNIQGADEDRRLLDQLGTLGASGGDVEPQPDQFAKAVDDAGFDITSKPMVTIPFADARRFKAVTFPAMTDLVRSEPTLVPKGRDRRFLWPPCSRMPAT